MCDYSLDVLVVRRGVHSEAHMETRLRAAVTETAGFSDAA